MPAQEPSALRWYTVMGNDRPRWLEWILAHPDILVGFSDAGAHLRNMAHDNFPLRMLRLARDAQGAPAPFTSVGRAVQRLTSELADSLGIDAGALAPGRRADLVVIDPARLGPELDEVHEAEAPGLGVRRLVRRNDAAVDAVVVDGEVAVRRGEPVVEVGQRAFGQVLRAGRPGAPRVRQADLVAAR